MVSANYTALGKDEHLPKLELDITELIRYNSITAAVTVDVSKLQFQGKSCFEGYHPMFNVVLHDGVSMPCVKEFLNKTDKSMCSFKLYAWVPVDQQGNPCRHFKAMVVYEDDDVFIISSKPHINYFPIRMKEKSNAD